MMIPEKNSEDKNQDEILCALSKWEKKLKSGGLGKVLNLYKLEQPLKRASQEDGLLPHFPFLVGEALNKQQESLTTVTRRGKKIQTTKPKPEQNKSPSAP